MPIPTGPLVEAFAASYSPAEVFSAEDLERVFGDIDAMPPELRQRIAERMRAQLAGAWRSPRVQEQEGTRRTSDELSAEVVRGYELAVGLAQSGAPSWERLTLIGDLHYDQAEFAFGQQADAAGYQALRERAFEHYADAAAMYRTELSAGRTKPSARVYGQWFSAAMGASDLGYLTRQDRPDLDQVKRVMDAMGELKEPATAQHVGLFAQEITRSMQRMAPELKPNFLRQAVRIIGEHPDGRDARSRLALYDDLDKEVELTLELDGASGVGQEPFGVHVFISSSRAVGRESGGFGKYLMNEQWSPSGSTINYRDDLEKQIREKWAGTAGASGGAGEGGFEVMSVAFHKPTLQRLGDRREGWERTPLCFVLLRTKDASVERVPGLKLDMDFSDGQGMVILPVASRDVPISSVARGAETGSASGFGVRDLEVEQILDDRESKSSGLVRLEVRARGKGIVPAIDRVLTIGGGSTGGSSDGLVSGGNFGGGLEVLALEDHGLSVGELQTDTGAVVPVTERSWTLTLGASKGAGASTGGEATFDFPTARASGGDDRNYSGNASAGAGSSDEGNNLSNDRRAASGAKTNSTATVTNKRYSDADLTDAPSRVAIAMPGSGGGGWVWPLALVAVLAVGGAGAWMYRRGRHSNMDVERDTRWIVPDHVSPVNAIGMLRRVEAMNGTLLNAAEQRELATDIAELERAYFAPEADGGVAAAGGSEIGARSADARTADARFVDPRTKALKWASKAEAALSE